MEDQNLALARQVYLTQKKDPTMYLLLALFLGGFGIHHFYLGHTGAGLLHLVFAVTLIPVILSIFHAINHKKAVQEFNLELAQRIAVGMNVPASELTKLALF